MYYYLPETKGHTLEDMSVYFAEITGDTSILEAEANLRRLQGGATDEMATNRQASTGVI
jgi:hypothetical protein